MFRYICRNIMTVYKYEDTNGHYVSRQTNGSVIMENILGSQRKKNCQEERLYAVALHQVAALSAKPVVRPEQDPLPESSSKLAAHSHQRSAEHHVGLAPVVHKRSPSSVLGAHSEASQSTWSHRPSRTAAARHVTIQRVSVGLSNLPSHTMANPPCTTCLYCFYVVLETPDRLKM